LGYDTLLDAERRLRAVENFDADGVGVDSIEATAGNEYFIFEATEVVDSRD
jgi:hypothetical protein